MAFYLVQGKDGYRVESSDNDEKLRADLAEKREAVSHRFGPKMKLEKAQEKANVLNQSLKAMKERGKIKG